MPLLIPRRGLAAVNYAATAYTTPAADFDGINDQLQLSSDLSGSVDAKVGLLSAWLRIDGGDASYLTILHGRDAADANGRFVFSRNASDVFEVSARPAGSATDVLVLKSNTSYTSNVAWRHVLASWNLATPVAHLYIDDVDDEAAGSTETDDTIDYTKEEWTLGGNTSDANRFDGGMADFYFAQEYLDITVKANRRLFIDPAGKPVDLGSDGSTPTRSQPICFFKADAAMPDNFANNLGSGGNFSVTGALANASTSPTD